MLDMYQFITICRAEDGAQLEMDKIEGSLGNQWSHWVVTMANRTDPYQVVIEGAVEDPGQFDIGIDDVVFNKDCVYYDGPYTTPSTSTSSSSSTKTTKSTTHTTRTTPKATKSTSTMSTTTTTIVVTPPSTSAGATVITLVVLACIICVALLGTGAWFWAKKRNG